MQWLYGIVGYFLIVTIIMQILPKDSYKKYISVYVGLLLMLIILQPLSNLLGVEDTIWEVFFKEYSNIEGMNQAESLEELEQNWYESRKEDLLQMETKERKALKEDEKSSFYNIEIDHINIEIGGGDGGE